MEKIYIVYSAYSCDCDKCPCGHRAINSIWFSSEEAEKRAKERWGGQVVEEIIIDSKVIK